MDRRDFLTLFGGAAAIARGAARTEAPDLILTNGQFWGTQGAQGVAISNGHFVAVGSDSDIRSLATAATRKIDLGGKCVVPGFIDSHSHVASSGVRHLREIDADLRSIAEIKEAVRKRAATTAKGEWIFGFKYDDTKTREGRKLTYRDLDEAAPDNPVAIEHRGGHTAFVNSLALQKADINEKTPDPAGGQIGRDADGRLTGELRENAVGRVTRGTNREYSRADRREGVKIITRMLAKAGVTSATDAMGAPEDLLAYQDALESGDLRTRIYCHIGSFGLDRMIAAGVRTGMGNEWVRVGAVKMVADGSISERTARLSKPYVGRPNDYGIMVTPEGELYETGRKAHLAGWQIGTHANGDVAIDTVLRVYERLQKESPRADPRFRLEHCTLINDGLLKRMKALNAIPAPFWSYVYYHGEKMRNYGEERLDWMFAMRSFLDYGIRVAPGSDYPPGPFEPMMAMQSCVTRTDMNGTVWGARQKIGVAEFINAATINGAYASFEERIKGRIEPGLLADLVVLGRDPMKEDPSTLVTIPIERTMVGGKWMYES
jgi:predicted amidohydrolase YtcJ